MDEIVRERVKNARMILKLTGDDLSTARTSVALVWQDDEIARLTAELSTARERADRAEQAVTTAASALENWGTHHAWCPRSWQNGGRDVPCECGYLDAIRQAHGSAGNTFAPQTPPPALEHVCGLRGFGLDPHVQDVCPACEANRAAEAERTSTPTPTPDHA